MRTGLDSYVKVFVVGTKLCNFNVIKIGVAVVMLVTKPSIIFL